MLGRPGGDRRHHRPPEHPHTPADGWQAGTCTTDTPTQCSVATPSQFYEEASGHPQVGFTQFTVEFTEGPLPGTKTPVGVLGKVRVDLPVGLTVNPQATPQCEEIADPSKCSTSAPLSQVGVSAVTLSAAGVVVPPAAAADRSPCLQPRPRQRRTGPLRAQPRRQQRLSQSRRRLGRRLPRGVRHRRPRTAARGTAPDQSPHLRRALGRRHLHHHPDHLPRPRTGRLRG